MNILTNFASSEAASGGLFGALGIDWKTLVLQIVAFAVLVFILAKFVYPPLLAMLDRRDKLIDDSVRAAKQASADAAKSEADIAKMLSEAREEAGEIVDTARQESTDLLMNAEADAAKRADSIVASARAQLDQDIEKARRVIRSEAASLVASATEKVVRTKVDSKKDAELIDKAIEDTK